MPDMIIDIEARKTRFNNSDTGRFEYEVTEGTREAVLDATSQGAEQAASYYAGSGLGWAIAFTGGLDAIIASGQWAEAAEFGIPAHPIFPHGRYPLENREEGFGPIFPPGRGVFHPGTPEVAMVRSAGDEIADEFGDILRVHLP